MGRTPLIYAIINWRQNEKLELYEMLVAHGADLNAVDFDGMSALHHACEFGNVPAALWLLEHPNVATDAIARGEKTPLILCVGETKAALCVARKLLQLDGERAIDVNNAGDRHYPKWRGKTALHEAASKGDCEMIELLLEHGAEINALDVNVGCLIL